MSFFARPDEITESEDPTTHDDSSILEDDDFPADPLSRIPTAQSTATEELATTSQPLPQATVDLLKDIIFLAQLEDQCFKEALKDVRARQDPSTTITQEDPQVQSESKRRFEASVHNLALMGMINSTKAAGDEWKSVRQASRAGLGLMSLARHPSVASLARTLSQDPRTADLLSGLSNAFDSLQIAPNERPFATNGTLLTNVIPVDPIQVAIHALPPILQPFLNHDLFQTSYYAREFEELEMLGKGGFGKVFAAVRRFDGRQYAVKKIPISPSILSRLSQGQPELDKLLGEIRTLAQLDHPNVVRYYNGWLEVIPNITASSVTVSESLRLLPSASESSSNHGIEFGESSDNNPLMPSIDLDDALFPHETSPVPAPNIASYASPPRGRRASTATVLTLASTLSKQSTAHSADVADSARDVDDRSDGQPLEDSEEESSSSDSNRALVPTQQDSSNPPVMLYIQMSHHETTLADYLRESATSLQENNPDSRGQERQHCFHVHAAVCLLLEILNGLQYLHSEGLVHRDLKPTNILLSFSDKEDFRPAGHVLLPCRSCQPGRDKFSANPRLADMGLATPMVDKDTVPPTVPPKAVGTEFYRPAAWSGLANEKLDVFALGVIALELLYSFTTGSERVRVLSELKGGVLPEGIAELVGERGRKMSACILGMVAPEQERLTCKEVREQLEAVLASFHVE